MKDIELPPLPTPSMFAEYWASDMHAYARAAVEAERAQRVPDVEAHDELMALAERIEEARGRSICVMPEFAKVLRTLLASTPAPAQQEKCPIKAEHKTVTPSGTVVTRLELTDKAKESLHANVTHIPGIAHHQEPPQQERKPMTPEQVGIVCDSAGYLENGMAKSDFINGIRHAERHHGIKE